jgi:hypothetical protein
LKSEQISKFKIIQILEKKIGKNRKRKKKPEKKHHLGRPNTNAMRAKQRKVR